MSHFECALTQFLNRNEMKVLSQLTQSDLNTTETLWNVGLTRINNKTLCCTDVLRNTLHHPIMTSFCHAFAISCMKEFMTCYMEMCREYSYSMIVFRYKLDKIDDAQYWIWNTDCNIVNFKARNNFEPCYENEVTVKCIIIRLFDFLINFGSQIKDVEFQRSSWNPQSHFIEKMSLAFAKLWFAIGVNPLLTLKVRNRPGKNDIDCNSTQIRSTLRSLYSKDCLVLIE